MDMYVRFYVAVCMLLLLSQTSSSVPKERTAYKARSTVNNYPYLALVECTEGKCSGSIVSPSKVLSYCVCDATNTKVYAGVTSALHKNDTTKQELMVTSVDEHKEGENLKIYTMDGNWDVTKVELNLNGKSQKLAQGTMCNLVGFGGTDNVARALEQPICDCKTPCDIQDADVLCTTAAAATLAGPLDHGGPVVYNKMQYGVIHMDGKSQDPNFCNAFIDISKHSDWILGAIEGSSTGNSTNGNGTTAVSSADSIYHQFKKHSKWRVGLMILLAAKLFLQ